MKSSPGQQPKLFPLGIEFLHAPKVGGHQVNGGVEDAVIEGVEVALLNERCADFMQLLVGIALLNDFADFLQMQNALLSFSDVFPAVRNRHARRLKHDTTPHRQIGPIQPYLGPKTTVGDCGSGSLQRVRS